MYSTRASRTIRAAPAEVCRALTDGEMVARWRGKTTAHTDTYRGHFHHLVPEGMVAEVLEFVSDDPALAGETTMTTTLSPTEDGVRRAPR